jgi:tetratricopeptide (TPR) repeat protein
MVDPPNPMPRYYEGNTHQGVQRRIYPYPMNDGLTRNKEDHAYPIIYLENEYLKIGIMPSLGGRIFSAVDKTNDYDFFYRQHVIKPSLIGMTGYWISGSNAWGFPHHHGPNTVKPMDHRIEANADGGHTVWIANTDQRHRMRVLIGYTLFPNSSIIEMTIRPMNPTPLVNSFLFWTNPSVHVNTDYQVIFPPSVKYVTQHAKREMTAWPIADRRYNNFEYKGIDISWWKNIGVPSSFFSWDPKEDYFGGYDHGKKAGTVWVGNHHIAPGMKFWAWGNNPAGDRANEGLTDDDGHYIELMAGAYTDNQPDYSWLQPYERKDVTMVWFPIRDTGGFQYANRNGALNLGITENHDADIRIYTTRSFKEATVTVKTGKKVISQKTVDIDPAKPFAAEIPLPDDISQDDLTVTLLDREGIGLLRYQPAEHHSANKPIPDPLEAPKDPEDIETIEALYLTGLRLNQFYNASLDPYPYYEEALKRDPGDFRVNTQLGILYLKRKMWAEAQNKLQTAVDRITANYTRPKDGEALYYLGVAQRAQGKDDQAYENFYKASWSAAWHTPAYYQLAEIDCKRGDYATAIDHLDRSLRTHIDNLKALNLKIIALRKSSRIEEALRLAQKVAELDPLDHQSRNELYLLKMAKGLHQEAGTVKKDLDTIMRDEVQSYLELAIDYGNCGLYDEAIEILARLEAKETTFPMVYYYLGFYSSKIGQPQKARAYYLTASAMPHAYCFPFRGESIESLQHAAKVLPQNPRPPYYLGNLLYENQPENAIIEWEKSRSLDDTFYIVHRNLGLAYEDVQKDDAKALASLEKAIFCNSDDPRLLFEMDQLYEKTHALAEKRYALLKENHTTASRRNETFLREATLAVHVEEFDAAIEILSNNYFPQFEGGREKQDTYLNAYVLRGKKRFEAEQFTEALEDFQTALDYPLGRWGRSRKAQIYYLTATAYEELGESEKGGESLQKTLEVSIADMDDEYIYYRALAMRKLGRQDEAEKLFEDLLAETQKEESGEFFRQFEGGGSADSMLAEKHYLAGLAYKGLGITEKANAEFAEAIKLNPYHIWSKVHFDSLKP